jgi:hypothetical protein
LGENRAQQLAIQHRYFFQQDEQHKTAGKHAVNSPGIPADAKADRDRKSGERDLDGVCEQDHHQPEIEHRAVPQP